MEFDLIKHTVLLTVAGSRAYGLHTEESDIDIKGVAIPPKRYYYGYLFNFPQADKASHMEVFHDYFSDSEKAIIKKTKLEGSVYEISKFVKLAADANPNILDVLFCRDEEVKHQTEIGKVLRENRDLFISAKAKQISSLNKDLAIINKSLEENDF